MVKEIDPEVLLKARLAKGLSQQEVANFVGISQRAYSAYEKGEVKPKIDKVEKLLEVLELGSESNSQSTHGIPLLPWDAIGGLGAELIEGIDLAKIEERYEVPLFKGLKIDFMIPVKGSSMYPKYNSGDVVACRLVSELLFVQWNKTYVLDTSSQGVVLKRLCRSEKEGYVVCRSDNKDYQEFELPLSDVRSIALVVGVIRLE